MTDFTYENGNEGIVIIFSDNDGCSDSIENLNGAILGVPKQRPVSEEELAVFAELQSAVDSK